MKFLISFHVIIINLRSEIDCLMILLFDHNKKIKAIGEPIAFAYFRSRIQLHYMMLLNHFPQFGFCFLLLANQLRHIIHHSLV